MSTSTVNTSILKLLPAALLAMGLIGCGGGSYGGGGSGGGAPTFTVGGTVSGLNGTVVLRNNAANDLTVSADGAFTFSTALASGSAYSVTVQTQPAFPAQDCVISNGSGPAGANVTNVAVVCSTLTSAQLQADAGVRSAALSWTSPSGTSSFNVYLSSERNCDVRNFASCPDGALLMNVTSPHTVGELRNGQAYFFRIETMYANGARGLSNEAGARPNALAFNDTVLAIAAATDGTVYLGGAFTQVGITTGPAVPLDASTGRLVVPDFPMVEGRVSATAPDGAGGWYLGGSFTRVGDVPRRSLAHILANGAVDPNFNADVDGEVRALAVSGSTVYVGGFFTKIGGGTRNHLAALDVSGALLPWDPDADHFVHALAVLDGRVFAGGDFLKIGGTTQTFLAAIDASGKGALLPNWNPIANNTVRALATSGSTVYAGGDFTHIGVKQRSHLAAIEASGNGAALDWDPSTDGTVHALAISGSTVYAGGFFTKVGREPRREPRSHLAAIEAGGEGAVLSLWDPRANSTVFALAISGTTVYAGGHFTAIGGARRNRLAAIDASGNGAVLPWNPSAGSTMRALAISGSTVQAGGDFTAVGGATRNRLAAIDAGGALLPWDPNADEDLPAIEDVRALAVSGSTVYAGGTFKEIGGEPRSRLAAIDADGTLLPWAPSADDTVSALAVAVSGSTVYAGGSFTKIQDALAIEPRSRLAAIAAVGAVDEGAVLLWNPDVENEPDTHVRALAISGSTVYAGGSFTKVGGKPHNHLAAIEGSGDGTVLTWAPHADGGVDGGVRALAVSGSAVYVGGDFTEIEDTSFKVQRSRLAAIGAVGAADEGLLKSWNPGARRNNFGTVLALAISGSTVYAGGDFTVVGGQPRSHLAAIEASGDGAVLPWDPSAGSTVVALAVAGRTVHVGGIFEVLGGSLRSRLGAVSATGAGDLIP